MRDGSRTYRVEAAHALEEAGLGTRGNGDALVAADALEALDRIVKLLLSRDVAHDALAHDPEIHVSCECWEGQRSGYTTKYSGV